MTKLLTGKSTCQMGNSTKQSFETATLRIIYRPIYSSRYSTHCVRALYGEYHWIFQTCQCLLRTTWSRPSGMPNRMLRRTWGAWLIFSAPPVNTISQSPNIISCKTSHQLHFTLDYLQANLQFPILLQNITSTALHDNFITGKYC